MQKEIPLWIYWETTKSKNFKTELKLKYCDINKKKKIQLYDLK